MFNEPTFDAPQPELIPELTQMVDNSVVRFKDQLGMFAHAPQAQKWIADYKSEVTVIARAAFEAGAKK